MANSIRPCHYQSAEKFLQSGYASRALFLLPQEDERTVRAAAASNGAGNKLAVENAAKLALLLARSFHKYISDQEREGSPTLNNLSSLRLFNFYVDFHATVGEMPNHLTSTSSPSTLETITLRRVDIFSPEINDDPLEPQLEEQKQHTKRSHLNALGKILCSVFCLGQPLPSDVFIASSPPSPQGWDEVEHDRRSTRRFRATEATAFLRLTENTTLSKPICRFLADMIDNEPKCKSDSLLSFEDETSDSPFSSFEEVLLDLEQMISQPQIFLHDSVLHPLESRPPMFGEKFHSREEEMENMMKVAIQIMEPSSRLSGVQALFVSGIAGSGKSSLVQAVAENLSSLTGWIVVKAKFERGMEHASRGVVSSLFDGIVSSLVEMKESGRVADVAFSARVSSSILNSVGIDICKRLVDFLPSLSRFLDFFVDETMHGHAEEANWKLLFTLVKIISAVLESGRYIMLCCDDLQWANKSSLSLIKEVLVNVGVFKQFSHKCLFVGLYRSNEIDDAHPFSVQRSCLKTSSCVNVMEIQLASLSKEDLIGMLMEEFRLPRRLVVGLADLVYKKTGGHAIFAVQLLNSFLRDSIVSFSPEKCRYSWDEYRISIIATGDSVAEFIASNMASLPIACQQKLRILACFGTQTDDPLLKILEHFHEGIISSIDIFIEMGILDKAGFIQIFTHDLIQQAAYESMPSDEQMSLHLRLGKFLGACVDGSLSVELVTKFFGLLDLKAHEFFAGRGMTSNLLSLACDQVNAAGPASISETDTKIKFASWNKCVGQNFASRSNFSAALFYFTSGIAFLGQDCWLMDHTMCLELHRGAIFSSFALGEAEIFDAYANEVIVNVPFEDTIEVQEIILKSLAQSERHQECITRGIAVLNRLGLDIPLAPSTESTRNAVANTSIMASEYSNEKIDSLCEGITDDKVYTAAKIVQGLFVSLVTTTSPFLLLIACEMVKISFQHGFCSEAALSFASFAAIKIYLQDDYTGGRFWANLARKITEKSRKKSKNSQIRVEGYILCAVEIHFLHPEDISSKLLNCYADAEKIGQADMATAALFCAWRIRLLGGRNLSLISQSFMERIKLVAKHSQLSSKYLAVDGILLMELTGKNIDIFSAFGATTCGLDDLLTEAESSNDFRLLHDIHTCKMIVAYWRGDYMSARKFLHLAISCPGSNMPRILGIYRDFFGALLTLHLHRQLGDKTDERLKHAREMMYEKVEKWAENAPDVFDNKWLLLQAEYSFSMGDLKKAKQLYLASIDAARDHGNIHELALAYELMGNHLCSINARTSDSYECFKKAFIYYEQWGATAVSRRLMNKHDLRINPDASSELCLGKPKHSRGGE